MDHGSVSNPLVLHCIEQHGGRKPRFLATIVKVEKSALYRACMEAVLIANQPAGPRNMNRCSEWGSPRVPVLVPKGGNVETGEPGPNPRPEWSKQIMDKIAEGRLKRIKFWDEDKLETENDPGEDPRMTRHRQKRQSTDEPPENCQEERHKSQEQAQQDQSATGAGGVDPTQDREGVVTTNGELELQQLPQQSKSTIWIVEENCQAKVSVCPNIFDLTLSSC